MSHKEDEIISQIYLLRCKKVIIDSDLARIYGVTTRRLNEQVRRNIERFPGDFMFEIKKEEYQILMSQIATSRLESTVNNNKTNIKSHPTSTEWGRRRKSPLVFTEYGALMLASVLNSQTAVRASIFVVRAFVKLRELLTLHHELSEKIDDLEKRTFEKLDEHSELLLQVFNALREIVTQKAIPRNPVGFRIGPKK